jgi:hypothetical protein
VLRKEGFAYAKTFEEKEVLLVKLFYKPLQGLRGSGVEPHIRKGLC